MGFFNSKTWNVELVVQKDQNIEKITFKFVQMKSLAMHILYTERKKIIWSPADFVRLPTDKEMISL